MANTQKFESFNFWRYTYFDADSGKMLSTGIFGTDEKPVCAACA